MENNYLMKISENTDYTSINIIILQIVIIIMIVIRKKEKRKVK